ncbi:unnamed protein product [Leptosia nina]|uniref:Uncharacterized protein n=1 Tax=Leptosia nina TaxID=320188 RepID=A0AAV1JG08_9NEOP
MSKYNQQTHVIVVDEAIERLDPCVILQTILFGVFNNSSMISTENIPGSSKPRNENHRDSLEISPLTKRPRADMTANEKSITLNVYRHLTRSSECYGPSKGENIQKTAEIIGTSFRTVQRIIHEYKVTGKVTTPNRSKPKYDIVGTLDDFILSAIRRKVNEFYLNKEHPTLDQITHAINNDDSLPSFSRSTVYKILKKLNFKNMKPSRKQMHPNIPSGFNDEMREKHNVNLNNVCRICLNCDDNTINLFEEDIKSKEILKTIFECFQVELCKDTYLPSIICSGCVKELEVVEAFRQKCVTFNERFLEFLNTKEAKPIDQSEDFIKIVIDSIDPLLEIKQEQLEIDNNLRECMTCNEKFESDQLLELHMLKHERAGHLTLITGVGGNRRYQCTRCTFSTPHSQTLVNHIRRHNGERPFHCECGKSFTQSSSLSAHRKTHSATACFICPVCGRQFKHSFSLKKHSSVHETAQFTCTICQKKLKTQKSLEDHIHRHNNVRNYNCEDCGDTFVTSSELLNHQKKHKNKFVECHLCGYKTHAKKNLIIHLKRHTGDKSYKCDVCSDMFFSRSDVERHQRVHTGEKPYNCPVCLQGFRYSTGVNKHMLTIHNVKYKWADAKWTKPRINNVRSLREQYTFK